MVVVYFFGFVFTLGYFCYTLLKFTKVFKDLKKYSLTSKIGLLGSFLYGTSLLVAFIVHATLSGLYHDANATGPSDGEINFNLINLVLVLCVLGISNIMLNEKND
jgi:hypothetical protein